MFRAIIINALAVAFGLIITLSVISLKTQTQPHAHTTPQETQQ
ncbi:MAG: hypothetical protein OXC44_06305 [Proteobacteria bacterium]|nr:hypothetical protein [Pseudomonadota bacterium]